MDGLQRSHEQGFASLPPINHGHTSRPSNRSRETTATRESPILGDALTAPSSISSRQAPAPNTEKVDNLATLPQTTTSHQHSMYRTMTVQEKNKAAPHHPTVSTGSESVELPRAKTFSSRTFSSFPSNDANRTSLPSQSSTEDPKTVAEVPAPKPRPWWAGSKSSSRTQSIDATSPSLPHLQEKVKTTNGAQSPLNTAPSHPEPVVELASPTQPGYVAFVQAEKENSGLADVRQTSAVPKASDSQSWTPQPTPIQAGLAADSPVPSQFFDSRLPDFVRRVGTPSAAHIPKLEDTTPAGAPTPNQTGFAAHSPVPPQSFESRLPGFVRRLSTPSNTGAAHTPKPEGDKTPARGTMHQSSLPKSSKPSVASLQMIIEQAEGEMDFDNPMSEADLSTASLTDFIEGIRRRRTNPEGVIRVLRFKQRWGANKIYVVDQSSSDEAWKKVRNEIKRNFETMKDRKPDRKKFEVDVRVEGDEEEDDDGDE